ncbi:MAG: MFS transporter, partial [Bacteroidota bacterium]|nr:MFS transporter [Bacteroidota bacterium]
RNLFAEEYADRDWGSWELPASWLQSVNSTFIIIFAPLFGSLWLALAKMQKHPHFLTKFGLGLLGLGAGFFVVAWGAVNAEPGTVGVTFLIVMYFLHTVGELCLSPVGMSSITKLAPKGRVGQMMGIWFVATALGNLFAGLVAGDVEQLGYDGLFAQVAWISAGAGLVALLLSKPIQKLTGNVS